MKKEKIPLYMTLVFKALIITTDIIFNNQQHNYLVR